ncbi:MAG TPA: YCF48-related protein, partial [Blastocatellia bacterium]|nr:YCF48-related protein [Blastocatellia bacterium]
GGDGVILRTDDGNRWSAVQSPTKENLNSASASEPESFWVVGSRGVILGSTDGGRSWTMPSVNVSNDLTSVEFRTTGGVAVGKQGVTRIIGH